MKINDLTRKAPPKKPAGAAKSAPPEWEHKQVPIVEGGDLQPHAADGWELVSVIQSTRPDWVVAYFKRRAR